MITALLLVAAVSSGNGSLSPGLTPRVHPGEVLVYKTTSKLNGAISHTMVFTNTFDVEHITNGIITFSQKVTGADGGPQPPLVTYELGSDGELRHAGGSPADAIRSFAFNTNEFGVPPHDVAVGSTWSVRLEKSDLGGFAPGVASVRVTKLDGNAITLDLSFKGDGNRNMGGFPGSPAEQVRFQSEAKAQVTFEDGVLTHWRSVSKEVQTVAGQSPEQFFKETTYDLIRSK